MLMTVDIEDTGLEWDEEELDERDTTDMIVLHHTGGSDIDASAEQIDGWHKKQWLAWYWLSLCHS